MGVVMLRKLIFFFIAASIAGCVTTRSNYRPMAVAISEPPIGQTVTVGVGEAMLRQGKYIESDSIFLPESVKVGVLGTYTFSRGYYVREGEDAKNEFYRPEDSQEGGHVEKGALTDPYKTMMVIKGQNTLCGVSVFNAKVCEKNVRMERIRRPSLTSDGFQQTLIYSGRVGSKVNISYREFSNNIARPAFNNDVEYDLGESTTIGYKGAEIEIIEATNRSIKYKVIRNFNQAVE